MNLSKRLLIIAIIFLCTAQQPHYVNAMQADPAELARKEQALKEHGFSKGPIPDAIVETMLGKSLPTSMTWPVGPTELRYLTIQHLGYDGQIHTGHMIVHRKVALEVLEIFAELFEAKFPIQRMELIDLYDADDNKSMAANNSSAFCCRAITDKPGTFSKHSYGIAIDINTLINPYIRWKPEEKKWAIYPKESVAFITLPEDGSYPIRDNDTHPGIIKKGDLCYNAFIKRGWIWGGEWDTRKDYQHFEKPIESIQK